ncbi:hypothetical protein JCM15765_40150 [Paradesulfitobacterium aromaticivorans]
MLLVCLYAKHLVKTLKCVVPEYSSRLSTSGRTLTRVDEFGRAIEYFVLTLLVRRVTMKFVI